MRDIALNEDDRANAIGCRTRDEGTSPDEVHESGRTTNFGENCVRLVIWCIAGVLVGGEIRANKQ